VPILLTASIGVLGSRGNKEGKKKEELREEEQQQQSR